MSQCKTDARSSSRIPNADRPVAAILGSVPPKAEYPHKADLRKDVSKPLPNIAPGTVDPASMAGNAPSVHAEAVLETFNAALTYKDTEKLADCFFPTQAFWRDIVALTSHLRTFSSSQVIATAFLQTSNLRGLVGRIKLARDAQFVVMSPVMVSSTDRFQLVLALSVDNCKDVY